MDNASVYQLAEINRGAAEAVLRRARNLRDNVYGPGLEKMPEAQPPQAPGITSVLEAAARDLTEAERIIESLIVNIGSAGEGPRGAMAQEAAPPTGYAVRPPYVGAYGDRR